MNIPFYISALFLALVILIFMGILYGYNYGLGKSGIPPGARKRKLWFCGLTMAIWLGVQAILAHSGFFEKWNLVPPRILLVVVPTLVAIFIIAFSKGFRSVLSNIPATWLIGVQSFRILMELILWMLFIHSIIPEQMTYEGRNFDVITGITAPFAVWLFTKRNNKTGIVLWNLLGLGLLINIVIIALLSTPSPLRVFMNEPANTVIAYWPFIWLPGFVVPFAFAMHIFSLRKLIIERPR